MQFQRIALLLRNRNWARTLANERKDFIYKCPTEMMERLTRQFIDDLYDTTSPQDMFANSWRYIPLSETINTSPNQAFLNTEKILASAGVSRWHLFSKAIQRTNYDRIVIPTESLEAEARIQTCVQQHGFVSYIASDQRDDDIWFSTNKYNTLKEYLSVKIDTKEK
jgi:hypothetical protein